MYNKRAEIGQLLRIGRDYLNTNDIDVLRRSRVCVAFRNAVVVVVDFGRVVLTGRSDTLAAG
jgi:hypothetical protein